MLLPECHINYDCNALAYTKISCYMPLKVTSSKEKLMYGLTLPGAAVQFHPHAHCPRV